VGRRPHPHPDPHAPLRHGRVRGHPRLRDRPGPGRVPPHRPHRAAVPLSPDPRHGDPLHGRGARAGHQGDGGQHRSPRLLHPPHRVLRLRRDGPQHAAVLGGRLDRVLAVGRLPRRRRPHQGRADEDQQLDAARPQHDAAGVQDHRQLRQLQPGQGGGPQGGLRRGAPPEPAGVRGRVHRREHLRGPARSPHHAAAVGRRPRGHHAGHGDPAGQGHGLRRRVRRAHAERPLRGRGDVRGRHRGRGERGELRRRPRDPRPRSHDARHR
jgi:hypothetical protein